MTWSYTYKLISPIEISQNQSIIDRSYEFKISKMDPISRPNYGSILLINPIKLILYLCVYIYSVLSYPTEPIHLKLTKT